MATLFIGIGSSGLHVLEEAQQFNYELLGMNKPKNIHYLFMDSDITNKPKKTPLGTNNITGVELNLENMSFYINNLRNNNKIDSSWIPDATQALGTSGAGGKSSYGRLSLWSNFTNVKNELLKLNSQYDGFDSIYVVGSITGGTGSGIFLDVAYLLRQLVGNIKIYSILMIPKNTDLDHNTSNFYLNSYFALKSLEYYSKQGNVFNVTWPDGIPLPDSIGNMPPFDLNFIVSPDYFDQSRLNNTYMCDYQDLSPLFKTIGLYVSLMGNNSDKKDKERGLQDVASARLIDGAAGAGHITRYITFGLSFIQYPKALLQEYVALDFATNIVKDWNDEERYNDKKVKIKRIAERDTDLAIQYILDNDLNDIAHEGATSLDGYVSLIINNIKKKTFQPFNSMHEMIFNSFNTEGKTNVYQQVKNKLYIARDTFIQQISSNFNRVIKTYPNLPLSRHYLESISQHLDNLFSFWKDEYGFDENPSSWNIILGNFIKSIESDKTGYQILLLGNEFYKEKFSELLSMLKLHLLVDELKVITHHLISPTNELKTKDKGQVLPSVSKVNKYINNLSNVIDNSTNNIAFSKRSNAIISMSKSFGMIFNIYPKGDFDSEIRSLKSAIELKKIINDKTILKDGDLWQFLRGDKNVYFDILSPIISIINAENNVEFAFDTLILNDAEESIKKMLQADKIDLQYAPPAFLKLDNSIGARSIFQDSTFLKTIYLFNDMATMNNIRNNIREANNMPIDNFDGSTFVKLSHLRNAIGVFKTYGYFGGNQDQKVEEKSLLPTRDLAALNNTKNQFIVKTLFTDLFIQERVPYFSKDEVTNNLINK